MLEATKMAAAGESCARRLQDHMLSVLLCPEKPTLTNLICLGGGQQQDWSADYRLYSKERMDEEVLFQSALDEVLSALPASSPLCIALDDTLVRKCGTHIDGVSWRRDPLGPAFQTNLVRGQRYLQMSAAWPLANGAARMVPVVFEHSPSAPKAPKGADATQLAGHLETKRQMCLNAYALKQMARVREITPAQRHVIFCGDGSYTNSSITRNLPAGCTYIGRIRKDAKLHYLPQISTKEKVNGRPACYGKPAPTPEELRGDDLIAWREVPAFAAGKLHLFRIKTLDQVLWRKSGAKKVVRVVVIAPLGYRLRKGSRLLYRQPAFLLCTDPELPVEQLLQYYLWRWGIEVNFRDEKTLLGAGQAQVRTAASNRHLPAMIVAAYSLLWVAALRLHAQGNLPPGVQPPKWRTKTATDPQALPSTGDLLRTLRYEMWAHALRPGSFYHFTHRQQPDTKSPKPSPNLPGALLDVA
jgi:hypothetical protein